MKLETSFTESIHLSFSFKMIVQPGIISTVLLLFLLLLLLSPLMLLAMYFFLAKPTGLKMEVNPVRSGGNIWRIVIFLMIYRLFLFLFIEIIAILFA